MQIAHEIQADQRRRASSWRFARRSRRRAQQPGSELVPTGPGPARYVPTLAPIVPLRAGVAVPPVTNVA